MLAINITKIPTKIVEIMATHLEEVLSNNLKADLSALQPCNHEKANTRLLLHALNASKSRFRRLLIVAVDILLYSLCVTSLTWISRSCGLRLVPERIRNGFPLLYMWKHCTRKCTKHCSFGSLWLDVILFQCLLAGEKRWHHLYGKSIQKQHKFSKGKILFINL